MKLPQITGHSGCEGTPRDSMASIDRAEALNADAVEVDIRCGADGILRLSHDWLPESEYREKPTLEAVFRRLAQTNLRLNCDIKEPFAIPETLKLAQRFGFDRSRLILSGSVSAELLALEPVIGERASVYLNIEEAMKFLYMRELQRRGQEGCFAELMEHAQAFMPDMLADDGVEPLLRMIAPLPVWGLNLPHELLTPALALKFREKNIRLSVWTVNEPADLERCLALGADNITTLAVGAAAACRQAYVLCHGQCGAPPRQRTENHAGLKKDCTGIR